MYTFSLVYKNTGCLAHLPDSIANLCDDILSLLRSCIYLKTNETALQELAIGNQKCDNADEDDANDYAEDNDMIPMCRPCFAGDTKSSPKYVYADGSL